MRRVLLLTALELTALLVGLVLGLLAVTEALP